MIEERFPLLTDEDNDENLSRRIWVELKKNGQISGPAIFSRFAMYSLTVITQAFAGHLSDLDMVAISIASFVIISISFGLLLGMASALETLCGQAYGAKQYHMLGIYLQRSWVVLFFCSILLLPMFVYATPMLKFLGQSTEVAEKAGIAALWFIPFHFSFAFVFPLQRFLQSQLKTSVIAWVSGLVLVLHVFVTWLFVYRFRVGIVGIALTLNFSWWVSVLGMFLYIVLGGCPLTWTGFSVHAFSGLWDFLKLATASGVMLCLENVYYRVLIIASKNLSGSDVVVDALSICITIYGWESMIPLGFFAATGVRVANELGAGNGKGAKFATIVSAVTSLVVGFFFWSMIMVFPKKFAQIFTSSTTVLTAVNELAGLLSFTILFNCIQPVLSGVAVGSGWQSIVAYINISCYYVIGVPLGILLGWLLGFGITGLWVGLIGGTVIQTMILIFMTNRCDWEKEFATIVSVVTSIIIGLFFCALIMIFRDKLALIFTTSDVVLQAVDKLALLLAITILLNSIQPVLSGVAIGSGWQATVAYINLGCYYIIGLPIGIVLGWIFHLGVLGIWGGMIGGTAVQTLILVIITLRCDWEMQAHQVSSNMEKLGTCKELKQLT